jgi:hypothetical protein
MIGLDPNAVAEFEVAGIPCRCRYMTIRQALAVADLRERAATAGSDAEALRLIVECLSAGGMISVAGKTDLQEIADMLTMREAFELLYTWPGKVAEVEAGLKKASPSPAPSATA